MAKYPKKVSTPIAIDSYSNIDLSFEHVTTGNFMDFMVAGKLNVVPKISYKVGHQLFTRLESMPVPTFGNAKIHNKAFFVPFRTIFPGWNDFIADVAHVFNDGTVGHIPSAPMIKNSEIVKLFLSSPTDPYTTTNNNPDTSDIVVINTDNTSNGYNLTPKGARALKMLMSLGYCIDWSLVNTEIYHNAFPLLSVAKLYFDWYYPSAYSQDSYAASVTKWFDYNDSTPFQDVFGSTELDAFFMSLLKVNYDSDYFTSAWDDPASPTSNSFSTVRIDDVTLSEMGNLNKSVTEVTTSGTAKIRGADSSSIRPGAISQYIINALKSLSDYMARHQISGARVIDRYLSRFGVTLSAEKLKRSVYLNGFEQRIQFGDVTSTADTDGANLGSYAGKGISVGNGSFTFESDEYGYIIIISSIVPKTSYYQGQDRSTMHQTRLDFWTPEFDSMGVQALSNREVFMPLDGRKQYPAQSAYTSLDYNKYVFGFVPRYAEYKRGYDMITGDYRLNSRNAGKDAWTLFRDVSHMFKNGIENTHHSVDFVTSTDSSQFNRIFYYVNDDVDHFNIIHQFDVKCRFPGKALYDSYEFENEDKADKVNVDINGVKAN